MRSTRNFAALSDPARNPQFGRTWTQPPRCARVYSTSAHTAEIVADIQFQRRVEHIHALGPRVVGELLAEIGAERGIQTLIDKKLAIYAELNPEVIEAVEAAGFWPVPLHGVER